MIDILYTRVGDYPESTDSINQVSVPMTLQPFPCLMVPFPSSLNSMSPFFVLIITPTTLYLI